MPVLTGHEVAVLREDEQLTLFRGHRTADARPVLALAPRHTRVDAAILRRFENELALADALDPAWAARPIALLQRDSTAALILDDPGGVPLSQRIGAPLATAAFLSIATNIAEALRQVHSRGIIHKDFRPSNLLVDEDGVVRVTGFGEATQLARERQTSVQTIIQDALPYMSPEQTGRMNRSVDARSDLYSLGIILYQLLTGKLPFHSTDVMGWIHCHIAQPPARPDVHAAGISGPIAEIVMRLIEKNAEDRYQSAAGLLSDLKWCQNSWATNNRVESFVLGANDGLDRLLIPERLYGREADVQTLVQAFDRVAERDTVETVLVTGYSGIGKSSVVTELHKTIVSRRGLFASGKFDQFKRDVPYVSLRDMFRSLIDHLLGSNDQILHDWRIRFQEALGQNAQLIIDLVPRLEIIMGPQPAVSELTPQDAQRRFQTVLRRFIGVFAQPAHPLTLFFDDLQWVDRATLDLLKHLATQAGVTSVLLVGAYRDNEVGTHHPLSSVINDMVRAKAVMTRVVLSNLIVADVGRLIAAALRCEPDHVRPLAQLVHARTGGNPFFINQFLSSLEQDDLLAWNSETRTWKWSIHEIATKKASANVVDLMVARLGRLPVPIQIALTQLACLGNTASVSTLTAIYGERAKSLHTALREAARLDLVSSHDDAYSFTHDRIQEAAYTLIPDVERKPVHLTIGMALVRILTAAEIDERIFDVVNHFNAALTLLDSPEILREVAELNLIAGLRARASTAHATAATYLAAGSTALALLSISEQPYRLAFDLEINLAECELLTGNLEAADERLARLSTRADSAIDRAAITRLQMTLFLVLDKTDAAVNAGLRFLTTVGVKWPSHPDDVVLNSELENMWRTLGHREIEDLASLPKLQDDDLLATVNFLTDFLAPASFTDNNLFHLAVLRIINLSMAHGNCDASACAYTLLNAVVGHRGGNYDAVLRFGQLGCKLVDSLGLDRFRARVYTFFGTFVSPWTSPFALSRPILKQAVDVATAAGDLTYAAYSLRSIAANAMISGGNLEDIHREADKALSFMRSSKLRLVADSLVAQLVFIHDLRGLPIGSDLFSSSDENEIGFQRRLDDGGARLAVAAARYHIYKMQSSFLLGKFAEATVSARKASELIWSTSQFLEIVDYRLYSILLLSESYQSSPPERRNTILEEIEVQRLAMVEWSLGCQENHAHRLALVAAEVARITECDADAMRLYDEAMRLAEQNGFVQNQGLAAELAARYYESRGALAAAEHYLGQAADCYRRWGASAKVQQLRNFNRGISAVVERPAAETGWNNLDSAAMIETSQAISEEIVLDRLMERLMTIAIEHAGADRAVLLLTFDDDLRLEAEAVMVNGSIEVRLKGTRLFSSELCDPILRYVIRTRESVVLDDALESGSYVDDEYIRVHRIRSLKCLPLLKQSKLVGVLYLENRLASHVFTAGRVALLRTLATQAAISLENARLFSDLKSAEARLQRSHDQMQMFVSLIENSTDFIGFRSPAKLCGGRRRTEATDTCRCNDKPKPGHF